jgi:hypothetical protein
MDGQGIGVDIVVTTYKAVPLLGFRGVTGIMNKRVVVKAGGFGVKGASAARYQTREAGAPHARNQMVVTYPPPRINLPADRAGMGHCGGETAGGAGVITESSQTIMVQIALR